MRGPATTEVTQEVAAGLRIVASITTASAGPLRLHEGRPAYGVIKASSVMVAAD